MGVLGLWSAVNPGAGERPAVHSSGTAGAIRDQYFEFIGPIDYWGPPPNSIELTDVGRSLIPRQHRSVHRRTAFWAETKTSRAAAPFFHNLQAGMHTVLGWAAFVALLIWLGTLQEGDILAQDSVRYYLLLPLLVAFLGTSFYRILRLNNGTDREVIAVLDGQSMPLTARTELEVPVNWGDHRLRILDRGTREALEDVTLYVNLRLALFPSMATIVPGIPLGEPPLVFNALRGNTFRITTPSDQ
jgi:hypothetical protein